MQSEAINISYINGYNMKTKSILRYPRLDTILMVEGAIKKFDGELKKKKLWESLPRKVMYQTFCVIFDYLLFSRKISVDSEGKIGWIYYPDNNLEQDNLFWRKNDFKNKS